jgi:uncharacterized membrane protein YeaQ/YmgE (transglycosylase-associated protein family)
MANEEPPHYPPGRPPHDPLNGMRAGGLIGGLLGGVVMLVLTTVNPLPILIGGAAGAVAGYVTEKRKQRG